MKVDMHVHTRYSDGALNLNQMKMLLLENNVTDVGIADHWKTKRYTPDFYVTDVEEYYYTTKETLHDIPHVKVGLEIDFSSIYGYQLDDHDLKILNNVDFVLFEYVDTKKESWGEVNGKSINELICIINGLKIPVGLAHNNFYFNYENNYNEVLKIMKEHHIFLELCEAEGLGKAVVTNNTLKKMAALRKNMSNLDIYNCQKDEPVVIDKKHAIDNKYYFEHFPDDLWRQIVDLNIKISISTDNHHGNRIAEYPTLQPYLEKYQLLNSFYYQ